MATRAVLTELEPYEGGDFPTWLAQQAELIRLGRWADVDAPHVAEELDGLGSELFRAYVSALRLNISHRLKFQFQPERASRSWRETISREIGNAESYLDEYPSVRARRAEALDKAWRHGRREAAREMGLDERDLPKDNPFSWDELMGSLPDVQD
jgi:hypothetical protein